MNLEVNSLEYKCWHEIGHAVVCLHLGGTVEFVEIMGEESEGRGFARARCNTTPDIRPSVLCAGFATEYVLSRKGFLAAIDEKEFTQLVFKNASIDREMYHRVSDQHDFSENEDREFMNLAVTIVAPIIASHFSKMREIVGILCSEGRIEGSKIEAVLKAT
ncbi:hypothetical protein [Halomonas chromatireducens]|uniref:hypothetical protein n=1 Tax=Halomonas chromatireducens TaxID=507626 RepID=UPI0011876790|nr:hypothetical protein [Halomonas chromatireducens]